MGRQSYRIVGVLTVLIGLVLVAFNNCSSDVGFKTTASGLASMRHDLAISSSLTIDGGAEYSNQNTVQLTLVSPRAIEMKISNSSDCSDGVWEPYNSAKTWPVANPNTVVSVYAQYKDIADNISPCTDDSITHDNIAPSAVFKTPPDQYTNKDNMTIAWESADNFAGVDHIACLDPKDMKAACDDHMTATTTDEGANIVKVKVVDKAGNESPMYTYSWVYDKTLPTVVINAKPATATSSTSATLQFSGTDAHSGVAAYYCRLDASGGSICTSPLTYNSLAEGLHKFEVYSIDKAGNHSQMAMAQWTVDLTAPNVKFTQTPDAVTHLRQATFAFTATDDGKAINTFQCSLDGGGYAACNTPKTLPNLADGDHTFSVRAIDDAGNPSNPISYQWVVDTVAPTLSFQKTPSSPTNSTSETFEYDANDAVGLKAVQCQLDGGNYVACSNASHTLNNLLPGSHTFQVKALDLAGNSSTIAHTWTIDLTAPTVKITKGPAAFVNSGLAQFEFMGMDSLGIAGYECRVDSSTYAPCTSPQSASIMMEGGHIFYVRAIDKAGNTSTPATHAWTLDTSAPLIRVISAPATLPAGGAASVQYEVLDTSSGLDAVECGLTSPMDTLADCPATYTASLGILSGNGTYIFEIHARDKVGNMSTEIVPIQVTPKVLVCDPFDAVGETLCNGGLVGDIYYLTGNTRSTFVGMSNKTVDYFYQYGTQVDALLNLKQLAVSTRDFTEGFPAQNGGLIQDNAGNTLNEYFAFKLKTVMKLDPVIDQPGWYQFATLSDDGSVVNIRPQGAASYQILIENDGDHSTRMGCSQEAIFIDDPTRLAAEIKYYQGPRTEIALMLLWRKVDSKTADLDPSCGYASSTAYFGSKPYKDFSDKHRFGQLTGPERHWKVLSPTNFIAPAD